MIRINKSQIGDPGAFAEQVAAHKAEIATHARHMEAVARKDAEPYPAPVAAALVEQAAREGYEIFDDGPTPAQLLRARKDELLAAVTALETAAVAAVVPPGKRRLFALQVRDVLAKDEGKRTAADKSALAADVNRADKLAAIERAAAEMHAEIEDLTATTIATWKPRPL